MATQSKSNKNGSAELPDSEAPFEPNCKIICAPYHFECHKNILASHSDYFKTAFKSQTFREGASGIIVFKSTQNDVGESIESEDDCDDPELIKIMVNFFYYWDYSMSRDRASIPDDLITHAKVFATAVKYQVKRLKKLAAQNFAERLKENFDIGEFLLAIRFVYESTPDDEVELRNLGLQAIVENYDTLQHNEEVDDLLMNMPNLAYNVLKLSSFGCQQWKHDRKLYQLYCKQCGFRSSCCMSCWKMSEPKCSMCHGSFERFEQLGNGLW